LDFQQKTGREEKRLRDTSDHRNGKRGGLTLTKGYRRKKSNKKRWEMNWAGKGPHKING